MLYIKTFFNKIDAFYLRIRFYSIWSTKFITHSSYYGIWNRLVIDITNSGSITAPYIAIKNINTLLMVLYTITSPYPIVVIDTITAHRVSDILVFYSSDKYITRLKNSIEYTVNNRTDLRPSFYKIHFIIYHQSFFTWNINDIHYD